MTNAIKRFFKLDELNTSISTEIVSGLITFFAMSYILFLNPVILAPAGANPGAVFTATALVSAFGTLLVGFIVNRPLALAPGMGLNSLITVTICGIYGFTFHEALAIVLISAVLYLVLTITKIRVKLLEVIPDFLKKAIGIGIGLFICFIGLTGSGLVVTSPDTVVTLGNLADPKVLVALFGLLLLIILNIFKVKGGIIIAIFGTIFFSIILKLAGMDTGASYTGIFSLPTSPDFTGFIDGFKTLNWSKGLELFIAIFSVLFLGIFNVAGTLSATEQTINLKEEKHITKFLLVDTATFFLSGFSGTSPTTALAETMTGIENGARSGLANVTTGLCFAVALFLSPLLSLITEAVTAPVLIIVGVTMMAETTEINWRNPLVGIPAFFAIFLMPLTYSITNGIAFGIILYVILKAITYRKHPIYDENNNQVGSSKLLKEIPPLLIIQAVIFLLYFIITLI